MHGSRWNRIALTGVLTFCATIASGLDRVRYNNPGLVVDLGVGLWGEPLPMDWDGDGDLDLLVSCADVPYNGIWFFENPGGGKMPVFKPGVRLAKGVHNIVPSVVDGRTRLLLPGKELLDFRKNAFGKTKAIYPKTRVDPPKGRARANQWSYVDYDADGKLDLVVGVSDWGDYGWDNAFDKKGNWTRGPLHGYVYVVPNTGTTAKPTYAEPLRLTAGGKIIDVYGCPSPNFADFDGDGDLDLLCGEFVDRFTYFENVGTRVKPTYAKGRFITDAGKPMTMDLEMIRPVAIDWDGDGDVDLVVTQEDGRVALVEHTGKIVQGMPQFLPPKFFRQQAADVKFGALVTPWSVDWDGDGDEDIVCGNTAGYVGFIENLGGGKTPRWAAPVYLKADGKVIRIEAGPNGSIQGPCEAKWGYTTLSVADWDGDSLPDVLVNSIWGKVVWFRNVGTRTQPKLAAQEAVEVEWEGKPPKPAWNWWNPKGKALATQWRTTPVAIDWTGDGLSDLVMLDHEGFLALFERAKRGGKLVLQPGQRVFRMEGPSSYSNKQAASGTKGGLLRLNVGEAGKSGRRKLCFADWDGDGKLDLLVNSGNIHFLRSTSTEGGVTTFRDMGPVDSHRLAGHTTSPTVVDWDGDGRCDLLIGAEDGYLYYKPNSGKDVVIAPADVTKGVAKASVSGTGFRVETLRQGALAYGNRKYVWRDVPKGLDGWRFTQTSGGVRAKIAVRAVSAGYVYVATAGGQSGIDMAGWQRAEGLTFWYTDKGRSRMTVYRKQVQAGEEVAVPQGNWSGGIVLAPSLKGQDAPIGPTKSSSGRALDSSKVPGVVIAHSPGRSGKYVGSPSIAVLPDGGYVASHDLFGPKTKYRRTRVFASADRGVTWKHLTDLDGQFWSGLFVHRGGLYLMGTSHQYGNVVIRRSTDGGKTWTAPADGKTGLLLNDGKYHCAPVPVLVHGGRIWRAMEDAKGPSKVWGAHFRSFMMSAPVDADLLKADSWTCSNRLGRDPKWLSGKFGGWLEGNAVATPDGEVVNILRADERPHGGYAAVIRISADGKRGSFDPGTGFIRFPGGCKKFTIRYDATSKLYWSLANHIPDKHKSGNPERTRNTLALTSSPDLATWKVRSIVLYHPDTAKHAFQYVHWVFEGDDLLAASRTAYDDGLGGAHNQHDANYLTFHRIPKFRTRTMAAPPLTASRAKDKD